MDLVIAITGASGVEYGISLLKYLKGKSGVSIDLIISDEGKKLIRTESTIGLKELANCAGRVYDNSDLSAPIASGSMIFDAMVIVPCSMSTLSKIAHGIADNLITRAAAVAIKEQRRLMLIPRETPLSPIHLENMTKLAGIGVCILPASPAFYSRPKEIKDLVNFMVGKILDQLDIEHELYERWG